MGQPEPLGFHVGSLSMFRTLCHARTLRVVSLTKSTAGTDGAGAVTCGVPDADATWSRRALMDTP